MNALRAHIARTTLCGLLLVAACAAPAWSATTPSPLPLSDVPLILANSAQPQVLIAVTNSQSMDGDTNGAIMTGASGCYTPTGGFVPPYPTTSVTTPVSSCPSGEAAYTYKDSNGVLYDNSESRLNVAKAAIQKMLNDYRGIMEFGLMDYSVSSPKLYSTWVYYMSQSGGFTFTSTAGSNTYPNPCYGSTSSDCTTLAGIYTGATTDPYLVAALSSDAPSVNDVLYAGSGSGLPSVFVSYDGPYKGTNWGGGTITSPYPPTYTLSDYESGNILIGYKSGYVYNHSFATGPTNAGYVPYSDQVMYAQRGFGYYGSNSLGTGGSAGNLVVPVDVYSSSHYSAFSTALQPETNSSSSGEIKANAVQSPIAGTLLSALNYYTGSNAPASSNSCSPMRYVVLITDGLPTMDLSGNNWPPLGSAAGNGYGVTATFNANGTLASTNDTALSDTIAQLQKLYNAGVETYIIGLGAGVNTSVNPQAANVLTAMAMAGSNNKNSTYFAANNATTLAADLKLVMGIIQGQALSTSTSASNSTSLQTSSVLYQARFTTTTSPYDDWTGNLLAFPIASNGSVNTAASAALWSARNKLDLQNWNTGRVIDTWNPTLGQGVPFRWVNLDTTQQGDLMTSSTDTLGPARLDYLRGDQAQMQANGGPFRNRSHILGDIVDSSPLYVGAPSAPYSDPTYQAFKTAEASRTPMIYVGANDGMLHAFDAATGVERFAFVPNAVFPNLMALTSPAYNTGGHQFYVDGSPTAGDVQFSDGTWHTLLVGGLDNGGNSIYALDVTQPSSWATESTGASNVLWEFTDPNLGQTYGQPHIARIPSGSSGGTRFVVIFGSGYNNSTQTPYLYVVNAQTGALIKALDLCSGQPATVCDPTKDNGTSGATLVYPSTNGVAEYAYVGDLQGNLWKVDLSSGNPNQWSVSLLFKATDPSGNPQPITTQPVVSLNPLYPAKTGYMVYFGTGQLLGQPDLTTTQTQSFYGIWDNNWSSPVTKSKLVQQTITDVPITAPSPGGPTEVRTATQNPIDWNTDQGWYMNLPDSGERSISDPQLVDGAVVFTTFVPPTNSCSAGGSSWLMAVDFSNGGALPSPELDLNNDGKVNSADLVNGQAPVGISLGSPGSKANIVKKGPGDVKEIQMSNGAVKSVYEQGPGGLTGRWSWWQLQ